MSLFERLKGLICPPINPFLLKLKLTYFLIYSLWISVFTYTSLISTQIISYQELAIIHAGVPACSILGPIFIGFVADKLGNYKVILMILTFLGGLVYLPVLWLQSQYQTDPTLTYIFPVLLIIRLLGFFLFDASQSLLDSCGMSMTKKHGGDFGRQKMWSMASMIVIPLAVGLMIDYISDYRGFKDYSSAFYVATGLSLIVLPLINNLDVQVQKNEQSIVKTARKVVGMIDVDVFLIVEVVVGICWGWQRSFFVVYTHTELDASKTLLVNELLDGASGFLGIASGNYFCGAAAPAGMLASMNGLLTAAVYGAGRGLGLTIGSLLISAYGIRFSYLALGILAGTTSISYMIAYHSCLKKMELARIATSQPKTGS